MTPAERGSRSSAARSVRPNMFLVAKLAGTSTAMIDKHYGFLRHTQTRASLDAVAMG